MYTRDDDVMERVMWRRLVFNEADTLALGNATGFHAVSTILVSASHQKITSSRGTKASKRMWTKDLPDVARDEMLVTVDREWVDGIMGLAQLQQATVTVPRDVLHEAVMAPGTNSLLPTLAKCMGQAIHHLNAGELRGGVYKPAVDHHRNFVYSNGIERRVAPHLCDDDLIGTLKTLIVGRIVQARMLKKTGAEVDQFKADLERLHSVHHLPHMTINQLTRTFIHPKAVELARQIKATPRDAKILVIATSMTMLQTVNRVLRGALNNKEVKEQTRPTEEAKRSILSWRRRIAATSLDSWSPSRRLRSPTSVGPTSGTVGVVATGRGRNRSGDRASPWVIAPCRPQGGISPIDGYPPISIGAYRRGRRGNPRAVTLLIPGLPRVGLTGR
jgi:hypothetical protein